MVFANGAKASYSSQPGEEAGGLNFGAELEKTLALLLLVRGQRGRGLCGAVHQQDGLSHVGSEETDQWRWWVLGQLYVRRRRRRRPHRHH
ncbi:hypothetical protein Taro_042071 [Colocasia esculenta]|uniref:Uncharacterized protein n=1 Tax=Colocasia esculenta TaxID=4460 RepID=A0A843WD06_COLES|nr:hypothetical protein [Colocasia esculenta]